MYLRLRPRCLRGMRFSLSFCLLLHRLNIASQILEGYLIRLALCYPLLPGTGVFYAGCKVSSFIPDISDDFQCALLVCLVSVLVWGPDSSQRTQVCWIESHNIRWLLLIRILFTTLLIGLCFRLFDARRKCCLLTLHFFLLLGCTSAACCDLSLLWITIRQLEDPTHLFAQRHIHRLSPVHQVLLRELLLVRSRLLSWCR